MIRKFSKNSILISICGEKPQRVMAKLCFDQNFEAGHRRWW